MVLMKRVGSVSTSPDGTFTAYSLRSWDETTNLVTTNLWIVDTTGGSAEKPLTPQTPLGVSDSSPVWLDNDHVAFLSTRGTNGTSQVWVVTISDGTMTQISDYPVDLDNLQFNSASGALAFTAFVYPGADIYETAAIDARKAQERAMMQVYSKLFVRHWDTYFMGKWRHVHIVPVGQSLGKPRDLMAGIDGHCPSEPFGSSNEFSFSPSGAFFAFSVKHGHDQAWEVDNDVWLVDVKNNKAPVCLTTENWGRDMIPVFSPDEAMLAWLSTKERGNEDGRNRIRLFNMTSSSSRVLTESWDRSIDTIAWSSSSPGTIYATANDAVREKLWAVDVVSGKVRALTTAGTIESFQIAPKGIVFSLSSLTSPSNVFACSLDGTAQRQLTHANSDLMSQFDLSTPIDWQFAGALNESVQAWVLPPVGYDKTGKYPVALYIHGGPEAPWMDDWSYRWNPQALAAQGFAVLAINFHGSPGWGTSFTESIKGDWGGKPIDDQLLGLDAAVKAFPWMDQDNVVALGASYGGYSINWLAGHAASRFRCLVVHDGLFNIPAFFFGTDELWFPTAEFLGVPWDANVHDAQYEKWSPHNYVQNWVTPQLVVHGGQDFRIPLSQGLGAFTALQRLGVKSKLLYFPRASHFVLDPNDSISWHNEIIAWLKEHVK